MGVLVEALPLTCMPVPQQPCVDPLGTQAAITLAARSHTMMHSGVLSAGMA